MKNTVYKGHTQRSRLANLCIGFDLMPARGEKKVRMETRGRKMHQDAAEWLFREVYA
jgi:hypothetical protein